MSGAAASQWLQMSGRVGRRIGIGAGVVAGLVVAYYALPLGLAIASLGEICAYSPAGTGWCDEGSGSGTPNTPSTDCREAGIRFTGKTAEGAEVCFTVSDDGRAVLEAGFGFVPESACPGGAVGRVYRNGGGTVSASGRIENVADLTGTISGATASGVLRSATRLSGQEVCVERSACALTASGLRFSIPARRQGRFGHY